MARYTGPRHKPCRRARTPLCQSKRCPVERRPYPPGQHGRGRVRESDYLIQLREKQKLRTMYGVLEKQFRRYYEEASRRDGRSGENLLVLLELRLDNVLYRAGWGRSRAESRQMVSHRHVTVNGRTTNIPSYRVKPGDVVEIREKNRQSQAAIGSLQVFGQRDVPGWLQSDQAAFRVTVIDLPVRTQIDAPVTEQMIVELYSK